MNKKFLLINIFIAILFFGLGLVAFNLINNQKINENDIFQKGWDAGWDTAKNRLYQNNSSEIIDNRTKIRKSVLGNIVDIEGKKIIVKIRPLEILALPDLDNRIILIDSQTEITKKSKKDQNEYSEELEKFYKENEQYRNMPNAPTPIMFNEKKINISELSKGQLVKIVSSNNIIHLKQFTASKITILKK